MSQNSKKKKGIKKEMGMKEKKVFDLKVRERRSVGEKIMWRVWNLVKGTMGKQGIKIKTKERGKGGK